ncbi:hypothetical protein VOLCADRAFT_86709 [Volvox carteri f. nagariensis]|uniref:Protein kinase domain-containing protein n=1 Tax=Volvox carteri f. nagariensis TaxID=3068 RepID=D8TJE2_VOLCA|nr:uncharacterized protein VOLCADRAFT_86709 [Volvox carteri f. nagariensis]EFJ52528.1 hypothetical protein VOLCADRAFT_86709 [Volvox carteri f. nagariensis]|eukprot:XP_002946601.1 hypothetical protein VOLCADRAFT_86709 [Volvox carteri f. nagariensis]
MGGKVGLFELAHGLDVLNTEEELPLDLTAAGATALLWPDSQAAASAGGSGNCSGNPASLSSTACSTFDERLANSLQPLDGPLPRNAAVQRHYLGNERTTGDVSDGARERKALPAAPAAPASQQRGLLLNLSQIRSRVQELRVLQIRPGAALLSGRSSVSGQPVVARFERGWPASLLAPQVLTSLHDGRWRSHPHVVLLLEVHAVALPAQVLDNCVRPTAQAAAVAASSLRLCSDGGGVSGGGVGNADGNAAFWESVDKDLTTAILALQQAEAVRGASTCGSAFIGSTLASSPTTGSGKLSRVLGGMPVQLRGAVSSPWGNGSDGGDCGGGKPQALQPSAAGLAAALPPSRASLQQQLTGGAADVALVTLSVMELCDGGNLYDKIRCGAFKCCLPHVPDGGNGGGGARRSRRRDLRWFSDAQFLRRLDCFIATARHIALGLQFLHVVCRMPHGDLVSRNVLLQRGVVNDVGVDCATGFVAKLAGYGRLAAAAAAAASTALGGAEGSYAASAAAIESSATAAVGIAPPDVSTTSLSRFNSVHVGLWRDVQSLAPERLREPHAPPTFEADVYAYGVLLYEMAIGESPWAAMLPACVAVGVATGELRIQWPHPQPGSGKSSSAAGAAPPLCITALMERCTSPVPEDRPNVEQILAALDGVEQELCSCRDLAGALQEQRRSRRLAQIFCDSSLSSSFSSSSTSRSCAAGNDSNSGGSSFIDAALSP